MEGERIYRVDILYRGNMGWMLYVSMFGRPDYIGGPYNSLHDALKVAMNLPEVVRPVH